MNHVSQVEPEVRIKMLVNCVATVGLERFSDFLDPKTGPRRPRTLFLLLLLLFLALLLPEFAIC